MTDVRIIHGAGFSKEVGTNCEYYLTKEAFAWRPVGMFGFAVTDCQEFMIIPREEISSISVSVSRSGLSKRLVVCRRLPIPESCVVVIGFKILFAVPWVRALRAIASPGACVLPAKGMAGFLIRDFGYLALLLFWMTITITVWLLTKNRLAGYSCFLVMPLLGAIGLALDHYFPSITSFSVRTH